MLTARKHNSKGGEKSPPFFLFQMNFSCTLKDSGTHCEQLWGKPDFNVFHDGVTASIPKNLKVRTPLKSVLAFVP